MADVMVTWILPTKRTDGSAFGTSVLGGGSTDYGGATIFRDGAEIGHATAPALVYYDRNVPPGSYLYEVSVLDKQVPPAEGPRGKAFPNPTVVPQPGTGRLAPPDAPTVFTNVQ